MELINQIQILDNSNTQQTYNDQIGHFNSVPINQWINDIESSSTNIINPLPNLSPSFIDNFFNSIEDQHLLSCESNISPNVSCNFSNQQSSSKSSEANSFNKDCSKNEEPWIPNVAKKILAVDFSPLYIKSELITNQIGLDIFESVALQEAVHAFNDIAFLNSNCDLDTIRVIQSDFYANPRPIELVSTCRKVKAWRKLDLHDKTILMANAFFYINAVKFAISYDENIQGWNHGGRLWSKQYIFDLISEAEEILKTFPTRFNNDLNVVTLLYLIVIFNPDLPTLKYRNSIMQEQYIYIYLLKRYLISFFGATCEAADYHYRLMVKIEQIMRMPKAIIFEDIQSGCGEVLKNRIIKLVKEIPI